MTEEKRNEIIEKLAEVTTESVDLKSLLQMYYDDQYGYFGGLDDEELEDCLKDYGLSDEFVS